MRTVREPLWIEKLSENYPNLTLFIFIREPSKALSLILPQDINRIGISGQQIIFGIGIGFIIYAYGKMIGNKSCLLI